MRNVIGWMAAALCVSSAAASGQNIVMNGGFEQGLQVWSAGSTSRLSVTDALVHGGDLSIAGHCHIMSGSCFGPSGTSFVAQRLYAVPGETYELTFWALASAGTTGRIAVDWNAQRLSGITVVSGDYTMYRYTGLYAAAMPNDLKIYLGNSTLNGITAIDDIAVTRVVPVPEPSTGAMLLAGLGLIGYASRRKPKWGQALFSA